MQLYLQNKSFSAPTFGSAINSRAFACGEYRYGMNGQEKDDELAGTYAAEYWQYDSRLGRRWNVDPVVKVWQSGFIAFRNNPLIFIDPKGDDDIFNNKGKYLGSTSEGNLIRVITDNISYENTISNLNSNTRILTDLDYKIDNTDNINLLINVATYYASFANIENEITASHENDNYHVAFYSPSKDDFGIVIDKETGKINQSLNHSKNFINIWVHEKKHQDNPATYEPLGHVEAILTQVEHPTWKETTPGFRNSHAAYVSNLLNEAISIGVGLSDLNSKIDKVNNSDIGSFYYYNENENKVGFSIILETAPVNGQKSDN